MSFKENPIGIHALAIEPGLAAALAARGRTIAKDARQLCPSSRIAEEIQAEAPAVDELGAFVRVNAHHWASGFVEFGTIHQQPTAMLRRAAERGGRFRGGSK